MKDLSSASHVRFRYAGDAVTNTCNGVDVMDATNHQNDSEIPVLRPG